MDYAQSTIGRLKQYFTGENGEEVTSTFEDDLDDTDMEVATLQEGATAHSSTFGKKLGNFHFLYLPDDPPLQLRGETYKIDHIKVPSGAHKFDMVGLDVYSHKTPPGNICANWRKSKFETLHPVMKAKGFKLIVHYLVPGSPNLTATFYFVSRKGVLDDGSKFARLFRKFVTEEHLDSEGNMTKEAGDAYRRKTFKFIPRFVKGARLAKRVAGEKPAIICRKIPSKFYCGKDYLEINLDISTSRIAKAVLVLVKRQLKGMILDMVFLLEGKDETELPEELISGARLFNPSLDNIEKYDK